MTKRGIGKLRRIARHVDRAVDAVAGMDLEERAELEDILECAGGATVVQLSALARALWHEVDGNVAERVREKLSNASA